MLQYAVAAAEHARRLKAHREAAPQYARALRCADGLPPAQRAGLLEARSYECYLAGQLAETLEAQRGALEISRRLGARPAAAAVARRLRALGVRGVPRGPRPATRANPAGLTEREVDVLRLMVRGLRDAEIAEHLSVSPKTVSHHVSAVLAKLGARSRTEAVRAAARLGFLPPN